MEPKFIESEKGKPLLVLNGFKFAKKKVLMKSEEVFWSCAKKNCNAKVFTIGDDNIISRQDQVHNHESDLKILNRQIISASVKRKAIENVAEKPAKLIHRTINENTDTLDTLSTSDINNIRKTAYYARRKILPPLPKSRAEIFDILENIQPKTLRGDNFLFLNDKHKELVIFSTEDNIKHLCMSEKIYMDGTFQFCTKFFVQFFTIHILQNGHYIPLVFSLLSGKQETVYKTLFSSIIEKCNAVGYVFKPKKIVTDFEKAIQNAARLAWPDSELEGCRFHLAQAWFRQIQKMGLVPIYREVENPRGQWLRFVFGLPFLKPQDVGDCFAFDLGEIQPNDVKITEFADYLVTTYIDENACFPPILWAHQSVSQDHTTNACESFHSKFNKSFYSNHPALYNFLDVLKDMQTDTYMKLRDSKKINKISNKAKSRQYLLESKLNQYISGDITRFEFIKFMSNVKRVFY